MRLPGRKLIRRLLRPVATALFPGAVVLGYHRVADVTWDPLGLAVGIDVFRQQLNSLRRRREIVTLGEIVHRARAGEGVEKYAALTFDDGYADFVDRALPVLEETAAPATVFVATGFTGGTFWWEQVAALVTSGGGAGGLLAIDDGAGTTYRFEDLSDPARAAAAVRTICHDLRSSDARRVEANLRQIRRWASPKVDPVRAQGGLPMSRGQVAGLGSHPLVEVGAHTVGHGCLGDMDVAAQRGEIHRSRDELLSIIGRDVTSFSYPNGSFSSETPDLIREAGFECACASTEGVYRAGDDPFLVPRIWVPDIGGAGFDAWLSPWVGSGR